MEQVERKVESLSEKVEYLNQKVERNRRKVESRPKNKHSFPVCTYLLKYGNIRTIQMDGGERNEEVGD